MKLKTLLDVDWSGKIVLVRTDYNVPVAKQANQVYKVADPRRIERVFILLIPCWPIIIRWYYCLILVDPRLPLRLNFL